MVKRKAIGLSYIYNENWIGGTYYIENLVHALNSLNDDEKPHITLIISGYKKIKAAKGKFTYPYLSFRLDSGEKNVIFQFVNKVTNRLFKKRIFPQQIKNLDAVFPYYQSIQQSAAKKKIYWIPDFQEHFITGFSDKEGIESRVKAQTEIQNSLFELILSSNNALGHFKHLYPQHKVKVHVLPFAVSHPPYNHISLPFLLEKYNLPEKYFICPNQLWAHKNQAIILKAIKSLNDKGLNITVAFTGNTNDYRNPEYFIQLNKYVAENNLTGNIKFLGFIDRQEQLQLMNNSIAIIQPSLFEGWSTVVEDAKLMNKLLLVSDIEVHHEQLINSNALFFDPKNEQELAILIEQSYRILQTKPLFDNYNYPEKVKTFGHNFLKIID
jgi:glycosyltransferase involved in cell wall biosynthesis